MNIKYMPEIDVLYIYIDSKIPKVLVPSTFDERVGVFVDKKSKVKVCGYEIEGASKFLLNNLNKFDLSLRQVLAVAIYFIRVSEGYSQEAMAREINVSLSTYKNLEKAEQNLTFDIFEIISEKFPRVKRIIGETLLAS